MRGGKGSRRRAPVRTRRVRVATAAAAVALGVASAGPARAQAVHWEVAGDQVEENLGYSIAVLPDLNGDGTPEIAAGAPGADSVTGQVRILSGADGEELKHLVAPVAGFYFGRSLASLGDVNGDGSGDLAVGAPRLSNPSGLPGYVSLFSGADGSLLKTIDGSAASELFGASVAGVGDLDGDGAGDVLVGAPGPTGKYPGSARVFSGATGNLLFSTQGFGTDNLGRSVALGGDLDGDGRRDLVVGAPGAAPAGILVAGQAVSFSAVDFAPLVTVNGKKSGEVTGISVSWGGGDVNGDGADDTLIGAPNAKKGAGLVYLASKKGVKKLKGSGSGFGYFVGGGGDADGDGHPDVVIVSPFADGNSGRVTVASVGKKTWRTLYSITGDPLEFLTDTGAVALADLNGDGRADLVVGSWSHTPAGTSLTSAGKVTVYLSPGP